MILHEHVPARNPEVVEDGITVVLILEAVLGPNVSQLDAFKRLQRGWVSDGHQKRVDSVLLAADDELGKYCRVVGVQPRSQAC